VTAPLLNVGLVAVGTLALLWPANWLVRGLLRRARTTDPQISGAGRWIGPLERLLVFVFMVLGEPAGAGFVVAAKSILRYPEISGKDPQVDPEYVLVGSMTSWLLAVTVGAGVRLLLV
jgi:hypothetical protein